MDALFCCSCVSHITYSKSNEHWYMNMMKKVLFYVNKINQLINEVKRKRLTVNYVTAKYLQFTSALHSTCRSLPSEMFVIKLSPEKRGRGHECLVPLSTPVSSGVWSCPQHPGWMIMISLIDRWAPPVPHCDDLSTPKLRPLVACVFEWKDKMHWAH